MLKVIDLEKEYEGKPLLCGVSFEVGADETVCLLGRSGGGKSTILRIIAGLEEAESGQIFWEHQNLAKIPAHQRSFGLMFQDYALFLHLDVYENIAFGLRIKKLDSQYINERVAEVLALVGMDTFGQRSVHDLSGGEKQRVAFARAIAPDPKMLMLDEPMGALDRTLRDQLLKDLQALLAVTDIPVIYVTHDQEEAFAVADRILILNDGQIIQEGTPQDVYSNPKDLWIASFLGLNNRLSGRIVGLDPFAVETPIGSFEIDCPSGEYRIGSGVELLFMDIQISQTVKTQGNTFPAEVTGHRFQGYDHKIKICIAGKFDADLITDHALHPGEIIQVSINTQSVLCFAKGKQHENC